MTEVETRPRGTGSDPRRSERLARALPGIVLLVAFGIFAVTRWGPFESALTSGRALLVIAGIAIVWIVLARWVLPRLVRSTWIRAGLLTVLAIAIVAVLVLPYYRDNEVVERFPKVETAAGTDAAPDAGGGDPAETAEPDADAEVATAPVQLSTGELRGIGHDATGAVNVYAQPNGTFVVGLEGIDVENGPDYFVHVVPGVGQESPDGGVDLGALRGNQGTQFYEVPAGTEVGDGWTVLIWCRAFGVPIANATQTGV